MSRIELIRKEEKKYHDYCYDNYKLFEAGSWLHKPVQTVMDILPFLDTYETVNVLDLGCGVGRNSIPIAEALKDKQCRVDCVDLLDSAIQKLRHYSAKYGVNEIIRTEKADLGNYAIKQKEYDFIVAVSSLEHVASEGHLHHVLSQMVKGTKHNGINCIVVNSEVKEIDLEDGTELPVQMEINISTIEMINRLEKLYGGWEILKHVVKPLEYKITRNEKDVLLKTNAITYVARKIEVV
ncbi:class I SAM-dependent methyltransferase [Ornithinibacillus salinisoli]|uniref:Class I SAM-dependent methyltransferase n=1 Tax=Ornithinibacillus salinisoli TaxID=1848459 RepID=A0ABW4VWT3_9BACI